MSIGLPPLSRGGVSGYLHDMKNLLAAAALALALPVAAQEMSGAFSGLSAQMAASRAEMARAQQAARAQRESAGASYGGAAAQAAPDFNLPTPAGQTRGLNDFAGQVIVLEFWANWSGPSKTGAPARTALARRYSGVAMLDIGVGETAAGAASFSAASALAANETILLDANKAVFALYGGNSMPLAVVIDRDGDIAATIPGADPAAVDAAIRAALAK